MIFGALWMAIGIAVGAWKTHGFRGNLIDFELPPDEDLDTVLKRDTNYATF